MSKKDRDSKILIEGYVKEDKEQERKIIELKKWVNNVDEIIKESVEKEIKEEDLKDDDKRIVEEFEKKERKMKEMEEKVNKYESEGKNEDDERMKDKMIIIKKRL